MAWSLCSRDDVISLYKIDEASIQDFWSETAEAMIREHIHAPFLGETAVTVVEYHSGDGTSVLPINAPPLDSLTSILIDGVAISLSDVILFDSYVSHKYETFPAGVNNILVTYKSGGTVVPKHISLTCALMIAAIAAYEGRAGTDGSLKYADLPNYLGGETANRNMGLVAHLQGIMVSSLKRYRLRIK